MEGGLGRPGSVLGLGTWLPSVCGPGLQPRGSPWGEGYRDAPHQRGSGAPPGTDGRRKVPCDNSLASLLPQHPRGHTGAGHLGTGVSSSLAAVCSKLACRDYEGKRVQGTQVQGSPGTPAAGTPAAGTGPPRSPHRSDSILRLPGVPRWPARGSATVWALSQSPGISEDSRRLF